MKTITVKDKEWTTVDARYMLCSQHDKYLQQLFLHCDFSSVIWSNELRRFRTHRSPDVPWSEVPTSTIYMDPTIMYEGHE